MNGRRWQRFYGLCEWAMRFAYVNLLWFLFMGVGLILFGFFPATAAMFTVVRKWLLGEHHISIWETFWHTYRTEFWNVNRIGLLFLLAGGILYLDLRFFQSGEGILFLILYLISLGLLVLFFLTFLFFFPVFVHYELEGFQYIKQSLLVVLSQPLGPAVMFIGLFIVYSLMFHVPGLIPFFSGSLLAYFTTGIAFWVFGRLEKRATGGD